MARIAGEMVQNVLDAFAARDPKKAAEVCDRDSAVDDFYNSIFRALLTHMMENPHNITPATHLLFVAKNLERIGDHATNVAEMVYFAATGEHLATAPRAPTSPYRGVRPWRLRPHSAGRGRPGARRAARLHFARENMTSRARPTARRRCSGPASRRPTSSSSTG
jgi:hypothetical protein